MVITAAKRIELAASARPETVELARIVSLASRVPQAMVRRARLRFLRPHVGPEVETALWFGPLVEIRGVDTIHLYPDVGAQLRRDLKAAPGRLADARTLVEHYRSWRPRLVRLEEELLWIAISDRADRDEAIEAKLRPVIKSLVAEGRVGLGRWALAVLRRLPEVASTRAAWLLLELARGRVPGAQAGVGEPPAALSAEERALFAYGLDRVRVGLHLASGTLTLTEPPSPWSEVIHVPDTETRIVELDSQGLQGKFGRSCSGGLAR